jgi:hypothetical protein
MPDRFHQIILFNDANFGGSHKHVFRTLPYVGGGFNDKTSSFAVLGGAWALYKEKDFGTALGGVFSPRIRGYSWVEDYEVQNDTVSCVELVDDDSRQVPHLILFKRDSFLGPHRHVFDTVLPRGYASFLVLSGNWQLVESSGNRIGVSPGDRGSFSSILGGAQPESIELVADTPSSPPVPHIIVFDDASFGGDHRHVVEDTASLGNGLSHRISSFAIEGGTWQFALADSFASPAGQVLGRGIYSFVEDVEIDNDSIHSVSQTPLQVATTDSVRQSLNNGEDFLTFHGDPYRLGWNSHETILTPHNVRVPFFGKLWRFNLHARVYGQVLLAAGVRGPGGGPPVDYLVAASANNIVTALDPATGFLLWQTALPGDFLNTDQFSSALTDRCSDTAPNHGVNSTPVIDKDLQIVYVAFLAQKPADPANFHQGYFLSALSLVSGSVLWTIELTWTPPAPDIPFHPYMHTQRAALTLLKGVTAPDRSARNLVLVAFSARCDFKSHDGETWRGWLFVVDVTNGSKPPFSPLRAIPMTVGKSLQDETGGGIWGPGGVAADDAMNLFLVTGNGNWDGLTDFADSALRFQASSIAMPPADAYTPTNWMTLNDRDWDLGGPNAVLLPPQSLALKGDALNLLVCGGKDGRIYLVNRDQMGQNYPGSNGLGHSVWRPQVFSSDANSSQGGITTSSAYFDAGPAGRYLYLCSPSGPSPYQGMIAVKFDDLNGETHLGVRVLQFGGDEMQSPASPFVSSNGNANGIVWAVESRRNETDDPPTPSILHAWGALSGKLLYSSPLTTTGGAHGDGESLGDGRKFAPPIVANGRVFVGTDGVVAYGLVRTD